MPIRKTAFQYKKVAGATKQTCGCSHGAAAWVCEVSGAWVSCSSDRMGWT